MPHNPHNPFRTPAASPNPTGTATEAPSNPQRYAPPSTPPPDPTGLTEEAPPAYTAGPDVHQGESTIEYGPSRPFQPAPPPPQQPARYAPPPPPQNGGWVPQQQPSPAPSLWQQLTGQVTGADSGAQFPPASWSAYPAHQQQPQVHVHPPPPTTHVSDFARDFYATTSVPPNAFSDVSGARTHSRSRYPPPPGAPPPGAARTPSPSTSGALADDGRPTTAPVPGHPLLRDGNMLVYPPHYECYKCNNTGYKHADPGHPCARCWDRFARPYAGSALAYAPHSAPSPSGGPAHASSSFQRPLPRLCAPPPGASAYRPPPPQILAAPRGPGGYPPPGATYPPGDARLGGVPCWRCGGRGTLSFLIFETLPCGVCRGVGRVFG
ncbi:hypothetical protein DFH07DRAFT_757682 [Mycena maculata]|uniref:Uncharacterized protein n=1 Tax=Mycena maculata TaxID=230809 RepID=A0AAD7HUD1_9AGAR|nr:hypothetical protein DFH07DRAFT_757682 [Mycena maculata]